MRMWRTLSRLTDTSPPHTPVMRSGWRVDDKALAAGEAAHGDPGAVGELDSKAGRPADRDHDRDPAGDGLGDDVEADPAADAEDGSSSYVDRAELPGPEHLVDGVVPADVLAGHDQVAVEPEHARCVDAPVLSKSRWRSRKASGRRSHLGRRKRVVGSVSGCLPG